MKPTRRSLFFAALLALTARTGAAPPPAAGGIPITFTLPKAGLATVVIEDAQGRRVRNLIAETPLPAGQNTISWDGYDEGTRAAGDGDPWDRGLTRQRVAPGSYAVRGLVHDRLNLRYEFSVNSPGTPPWKTADGGGGWLADHSPPADILYLPQGIPAPNGKGMARFLVCSSAGESGEEFVWMNGAGRRLYGMNTGFWGGTHLARDPGANPDRDYSLYTFTSGERDPDNNNLEVRGLKADGTLETVFLTKFPMEWKKSVLPTFKTVAEAYGTNGLAVHDGRIVVAWTRRDTLLVADARTKRQVAAISFPAPRGLAFGPRGDLYLVSGHAVKRARLSSDGARLVGMQTVVAGGLQDPHRLTLDGAGDLYVTDWGASHQVKVFSPSGKLLRTLGRPGGPQLGRYDERRMAAPAGLTVDGGGRLWVAEANVVPKRLSVWDARTGRFVRAIYGPSQYGGGGKIDPEDPTRLYMDPDWSAGLVTWSLDWKAGTGRPVAVAWRSDSPRADAMPSTAPETIFRRGGFRYLTDCYNDFLRYNQDRGVGLWRLDKDEVARPVALIGNAADLVNQTWGIPLKRRDEIVKLWRNLDPATVMFVWTDRNGDGFAEPDEFRFRQFPSRADGAMLRDVGLGAQVQPDLSFITTWGLRVAAPAVDSQGVPQYDLGRVSTVGDPNRYSERVPGGEFVVYNRIDEGGLSGSKADGSAPWRYQSAAGGQPFPGQLTQPNRLLSLPVTPRRGDAGPLLAVNSDRGGVSLLTTDGLYLQTLGGDMRDTPLWRTPASGTRRGMSLDGLSFEDEQFHPTVTQLTQGGAIYFVVGKEHSSIARLDGLETVRRLPLETITVRAEQLAGLPEIRTEATRRAVRNTLTVPLVASPPPADPALWPAGGFARLDSRASAALTISGGRLYAAYRTGDPNALDNSGGDIHTLFKKGGALDLMLGTDPNADPNRRGPAPGDERLLVTRVAGRTEAVLFQAVVPGTHAGGAYEYQSPVGRVDFDRVTDISAQVTLTSDGKGGWQFSVPLSVLGLTPRSGQEIAADIGLLRGNAGQTTQRLYWNNQDALIVSDLPSEARLAPGEWGEWHFQ